MKRFSRQVALQMAALSLSVVSAALHCAAQQPSPRTESPRVEANETFELNIVERRITERDFAASTSVGIDDREKQVNVQIGVGLHAEKIDVLLRNVTGNVRFRGSIQRILDLVKARPSPPPR